MKRQVASGKRASGGGELKGSSSLVSRSFIPIGLIQEDHPLESQSHRAGLIDPPQSPIPSKRPVHGLTSAIHAP